MFPRNISLLAIIGVLVPLTARAQSGAVPNTPVGAVVREWFDAFGSGDTLRILDFYRRYMPERMPQGPANSRADMGRFDLVSVEKSEPRRIEMLVREKRSQRIVYGMFELASGEPPRVAHFALSPIPPHTTLAALSIDATGRAAIITKAIALLDSFYVIPEVAKQIADSLRARRARGSFDAYTNKLSFSARLRDDLRELSRDKHMGLSFIPRRALPPPPQGPADPGTDEAAREREFADMVNCEFVKAERLEGNIGYLKFDAFMDVDLCGATASAAMNFVAATRALIIDMRENGGGSPAMVSYVLSYLFPKRTHMTDLRERRTGEVTEFWTRDSVPGPRFGGDKPVYVLTSANTISGAEEFTYNLKVRKRATIVGEVTAGAAHATGPRTLVDGFILMVPDRRPINAVTGTNWEGVGVEPDIKTSAADALAAALKHLRSVSRP